MKKILISVLSLSALLFTQACNLLDLEPKDWSAGGNYWKNEAQVKTYLNGVYDDLRSNMYTMPFVLGETRGGTLRAGNSIEGVSLSYPNMVTQTLTKDVTGITNWYNIYYYLLPVNQLIYELENHCSFLDEAGRNKYLAPAYGIRAYYYFYLYRTFGGVMLEIEPKVLMGGMSLSDYYMPRSTAEETLAFIKDDLKRSEDAYGATRDFTYCEWNYYATEMLKGQVYLWAAKVTTMFQDKDGKTDGSYRPANKQADLNTAKEAFQKVVDSRRFSLVSNFADIFRYENKGNAEEIFALKFDRTETINAASQFVYQASLWNNNFYGEDATTPFGDPLDLCGGGMHRDEYRESFVKSFDKEDSRRAATFFESYDKPAGEANRVFGNAMLKYMGHVADGNRYYDSDVIIFRYADVLLSLAEIENGLDNQAAAAEYINQIRRRAYGDQDHDYTAGDKAQVELAILAERDKEFVAEGSRWFDLLRMQDASGRPLVFSADAAYADVYGQAATPVLSADKENMLLWPVNVSVLSGDDKIAQTYGY